MDSYGFLDSIQVEKAHALSRYKQFNNISRIFKLIEVFVAVALISWSSTRLPTVFKVSGEYLYACSSYILNQHVVFLIGNFIVVLCYVFSGHMEVGNESIDHEISDENKKRSTNHYKTSDAASDGELLLTPVEELPVIHTAMEEPQEKVIGFENSIVKTESEVAAEMAIKQAAKQIERFQRTQSAKLKREISMKQRTELRRSMTERRRSVVLTSGDGDSPATSSETVERLSNEEFRLAVEAFILKQQSFLKQQTLDKKTYYY
ncbi:uncharacterized protein LOC111912390 [Lactuca sativa]|uniref:uncharacterized protein LOC111912390 n=1 Tax=Lactuca sativa TaxID=4236 RepID=UPI000CBFB3D7|nr:uncharacterized protein LOC111912390 [Lactuca sativa]